jgi:two-component system, OmpR family, phosphate regulon sensor histidine kinase PhoR
MAASNLDDGAGPPLPSVSGRLREARWLLVVTAIVLVILYAASLVSAAGAVVVFIILAGTVALAPRPTAAERRASQSEPAQPVWPETGIKRFAEALPDPCFVLDRRGVVRYANERALIAFPIRTGEALTSRLRAPDLVAAFDRVAKGGVPERVEFAERVPTERWFGAWFARLDGSDGRGPFIALILDDLSEQRRTDRIRVDFVANASHELRTPLASLVGFIETLQGPAREDPVARERFLKIMHDQTARMSRLVNDLLSLSRIEMKAHLRPAGDADLVAIIRHLEDALEPLARDLGVAFETVVPDAPVVVTGERDELIQVFENLIENACKYGQSGEKVVVTVTPGRDGVGPTVSVRDFGPGIAEEHLPRLTERFYRVDVEASRQHRGTGLGLAIVKHILARHQGRLAVESTLGEGANFIVMFPQSSSSKVAESAYLPVS